MACERLSVSVKVKRLSNGEIRRLRLEEVDGEDLFTTLLSQVHSIFGKSEGKYSYIDPDGDVIVISDGAEVREAIRLSPSLLTVHWKEEGLEEHRHGQNKPLPDIPPSHSSSSSSVLHASPIPPIPTFPSKQQDYSSESDSTSDSDSDSSLDDFDFDVYDISAPMESDTSMDARFETKKARIVRRIEVVKSGTQAEAKKEKKVAKLQRKLEKLDRKKEKKRGKEERKRERAQEKGRKVDERKSGQREKRLTKIRNAKSRIESKQERVRVALTNLEKGDPSPNRERKAQQLNRRMQKLENRHAYLVSEEKKLEGIL